MSRKVVEGGRAAASGHRSTRGARSMYMAGKARSRIAPARAHAMQKMSRDHAAAASQTRKLRPALYNKIN